MIRRLVLSILVAAALRPAHAAPDPIKWTVNSIPQKPLAPGSVFSPKLMAQIDSGWHLYALEQEDGGPFPLEIALSGDDSSLTLGVVAASKPVQLIDKNFNKRVSLYIQKAEFRLPLTISSAARSGPQRSSIQVRYQCCDESMCLPPRTANIDVPIVVK